MKINFGELAKGKVESVKDNVTVVEGNLKGTKVSLVSTTMNAPVTFEKAGIVFPLQAMGTLTTSEGTETILPGEMLYVESGDVFTPQLGFATLVLLNNKVT